MTVCFGCIVSERYRWGRFAGIVSRRREVGGGGGSGFGCGADDWGLLTALWCVSVRILSLIVRCIILRRGCGAVCGRQLTPDCYCRPLGQEGATSRSPSFIHRGTLVRSVRSSSILLWGPTWTLYCRATRLPSSGAWRGGTCLDDLLECASRSDERR